MAVNWLIKLQLWFLLFLFYFIFVWKIVFKLRHECFLSFLDNIYLVWLSLYIFLLLNFHFVSFGLVPNILPLFFSFVVLTIIATRVLSSFLPTVDFSHLFFLNFDSLFIEFPFEIIDGLLGCSQTWQVILLDITIKEFAISILILKILFGHLVIFLPGC